MKKYIYIISIFSFIILSCSKEDSSVNNQPSNGSGLIEQNIIYPDSATYGLNILNLADSSTIVSGQWYSFNAILEKDASLKIIISNYSNTSLPGGYWSYENASNLGWNVNTYDNIIHEQLFQSSSTSSIILKMQMGSNSTDFGECRLDFYENNSTSITKSRYLFWQ